MLLERERELAAIEALVAQGNGALLVEGPPGIGKTTLLRAARASAAAAGKTTLVARGGELERGFPFGVARQLFTREVARGGEELLTGGAGWAAPLFDPAAEARAPAAVVQGLYWLLERLSEANPLVLVVDDAQWADDASVRFLDVLVRRIEDLPVGLLLAARPHPPTLAPLRAGLRRIAPDPLSRAATAAVIKETLGRPPDEPFAAATHELTGGNPFLLVELTRELSRAGVTPDVSHRSHLDRMRSDTVITAVLDRLRALGPDHRSVAEAVAVIGDDATPALVAVVSDVPAAAELADTLAEAHILNPGRPLTFRHPLLRGAVLESTPRARLSRLHRAAAKELRASGAPIVRVATTLLPSDEAGDPETVAVLRQAAQDALASGSPESAATFLRRAIAEAPPAPELRLALGEAVAYTDPAAAEPLLLEAATEATEPVVRAAAARVAGQTIATLGRIRDAYDYVESQIAQLDDPDVAEVRNLARMAAELSVTAVGRGDGRALQRYWAWAGGHESDAPVLAAQRAYVTAAIGGDREHVAAMAHAADGPALATLGPDAYSVAAIGIALHTTGDYAAAADVFSRALAAAEARGSLTAIANLLMWRSLVALGAGDLRATESDADTSLRIAADTGQSIGVPIAVANLATALVARGEGPAALTLLNRHPIDEIAEDNNQGLFALIARGETLAALGRTADAIADFERVGRLTAATTNPAFAEWRSPLVAAMARQGRGAEILPLAEENLALARSWGAPGTLGAALRAMALVTGDRLELLREAVEVTDASQAKLQRARAYIELGAQLRRESRRVEARDRLAIGLDAAVACGASALASFAREELVAAGARPRRGRLSGPESLTASERRVAELAASGMTNREIAQALYVTVKAVTYHLTSCYRKLDIAGRDELSEALGRG